MTTSRIVALLGACALVHSAQAALLAGWETTGQSDWGDQEMEHTQKHPNVTVGGLTRGEGVTIEGNPTDDGWGGEGWHAGSYEQGIDDDRFITFTLAPKAGAALSVHTFTLHYRRSTNGPQVAALQFQIGNGAFVDVEEMGLDAPPNTPGIANDIDLSSIQELQNLTGNTITFRLIPYAAGNAGGDFYVWGESPGLDLTVQGTVSGSSGGDTTPPSLIGLTPTDNATNLLVPTTLTAVFNEGIARGSGTILVKETATDAIVNALDATDPAQVVVGVNQIDLVMANPLAPGTAYHVEIPAGAVVDLAGTPNAFAGFTDSETWNFTTAEVIDPPVVVVNKYFNGSPERIELLVTGNGTPGSTVDMRGMILKDFSANIDADLGGKLIFTTSDLWSAVPVGTLITLTNWAGSPDLSATDFTLSVGLMDSACFTPVPDSPEIDLTATDMVMIKAAGSDPAGTDGGIHALAAGLPPAQSLFASFTGAKMITAATTGTNLGVKANNATATLADYMSGSDASAGLVLTLDDFGAPNSGPNAAFIAALRGRTAGQGDGIATVTNATLDSALLGSPIFDAGQTGNSLKVSLLAQAGTTPLSQVNITIPAALGTPSGAVLTGPASVGAAVSVNGQTIQVTSAAVTTGNALEVTISGISTPETPQVSNQGIYPLAISTTGVGGSLTPLSTPAAARVATPINSLRDTDANGFAFDSGLLVAVSGTVTEEDFGGGAANFSGFLQDTTGGICISSPGLNLGLLRGYRFTVLGTVTQTNGQTAIVPVSSAHIVNRGPVPEILGTTTTLPALFANHEAREGSLLTIRNVVLDSGTWGPGATVVLRDPSGNTFEVRVQPGSTLASPPSFPIIITGILGQSDATAPFTGSYYLMPRDIGDAVHLPDIQAWMYDNNVTSSSADDDHDGHDNAFEYAFGLDPHSATSLNPIPIPLKRATGKFTYTRRVPGLTGLEYRVFVSTNLSTWNEDTEAASNITNTSGSVETVEVTLSPPDPMNGSKRFVKVQAD
ncbi:Ig-like domain-containing protein [Luteolibacter arcticus]|uniref:Ig-like domain-containing protein n=1 Tax=Luteolibacter arcticus TaxID=1581411 RepID=A0ABT3GME6_9BACT|nr:Ig-like domain-containing protein [Luteolibacter arcticus]MCW1924697.1 Ig-like domain-containing protein [Luteolibacter arcticus]